MTYYNAIVITDYDAKITYHNISNPPRFVSYILRNVSVVRIFFYALPNRSSDRGPYAGYWNPVRGLVLNR